MISDLLNGMNYTEHFSILVFGMMFQEFLFHIKRTTPNVQKLLILYQKMVMKPWLL